MKLHALLGLAFLAAAPAACGGGGGDGGDGDPFTGVADFVHLTTPETIQDWWTVLDHPLANDNPDAVLLVTHNWNPGGGTGEYYDHPLGVRYTTATGRWSITSQDASPMPTGVHFNVTIVSGFASAWTHLTNAGNLVVDRTILNHPDLNGAPSALALVAKNLTPIGMLSVSTVYQVGLWYDSPRWSIYVQNPASTMGEDFKFNVYALPGDGASFRHVAAASSTSGNWTTFSHPDADGNPNAHVQVTHTFGSGVYNNRPVGVFFNAGQDRWAIYNEDLTAMPVGATYVVRVR